jgi:hypothetical protein
MGNYTRMVMVPSTTRLCAWRRISRIANPMVDGQGNFGSVERRSTSCDAIHRGAACLRSLRRYSRTSIKRPSTSVPNYDEDREETVVPAQQGTESRGEWFERYCCGMATNMPPHNLTEVCEAVIHLINNSHATTPDLMAFIPDQIFRRRESFMVEAGYGKPTKRSRPAHDSCARDDRAARERARHHRRYGNSLSGEQSASDRKNCGAGERQTAGRDR